MTDEHAPVPEAGLGDQRVGGAEVAGGDRVGGDPEPGRRPGSRQPPAQRQGAQERPLLVAVEAAQLEAGLAGRVLGRLAPLLQLGGDWAR